jgi:hypothetical protein
MLSDFSALLLDVFLYIRQVTADYWGTGFEIFGFSCPLYQFLGLEIGSEQSFV